MAQISSNNWMLDEVAATCNEGLEKEELIKKLAIQKIEYGRSCITEFLARMGQTLQTARSYHEKMDSELKARIMEIGGKPLHNRID